MAHVPNSPWAMGASLAKPGPVYMYMYMYIYMYIYILYSEVTFQSVFIFLVLTDCHQIFPFDGIIGRHNGYKFKSNSNSNAKKGLFVQYIRIYTVTLGAWNL